MNEEKMSRARDLYMNEGKTQKEIAAIVGVCERTIHGWIKQHAWDKLKQAAFHAPAIIADHLCSQIVELQSTIAEREPGKRFPTLQEAETTRKLICCLEKVKKSTSLAQNIQMIESFTRFARTKSQAACSTIHKFGEEYLEARAINGYKPYEMEYYPYNVSPFSVFDSEVPAQATAAPAETAINGFAQVPAKQEDESPESIDTEDIQPVAASLREPEISRNDQHISEVSEPQEQQLITPQIPDLPSPVPAISDNTVEDNQEQDKPEDEIPFTFTSQYFITLPPAKRPSPFREGNTIWVNHPDDLENYMQYVKMSDTIRRYDELLK